MTETPKCPICGAEMVQGKPAFYKDDYLVCSIGGSPDSPYHQLAKRVAELEAMKTPCVYTFYGDPENDIMASQCGALGHGGSPFCWNCGHPVEVKE